MSEIMYVRLKPYNPKIGNVKKRYHHQSSLYAMHPETGRPIWYKTDDAALLAELGATTQIDEDPQSGPLFDILSEAEFLKVQKHETNLRLVELGIMSATEAQPVSATPPVVDRVTEGRSAAVPEPSVVAPKPMAVEEVPDPVEVVAPKTMTRIEDPDLEAAKAVVAPRGEEPVEKAPEPAKEATAPKDKPRRYRRG
jgi:hypothetical protein